MIYVENGCPDCGAVTVLAHIRGLNMRRTLTRCLGTIVTTNTVAKYIYMIKVRRQPGISRVAIVTGSAAGNVGLVFTGCSNAIMAASTVPKNITVIEYSRQPGCRVVTVVALVARRNMIKRFSSRLRAVMAGDTTTHNGCVVHKRNDTPRRRGMAIRTLTRRQHMVGGF